MLLESCVRVTINHGEKEQRIGVLHESLQVIVAPLLQQ